MTLAHLRIGMDQKPAERCSSDGGLGRPQASRTGIDVGSDVTGRAVVECLTPPTGAVACVIDPVRPRSQITLPTRGRMDDRQPSVGLPSERCGTRRRRPHLDRRRGLRRDAAACPPADPATQTVKGATSR